MIKNSGKIAENREKIYFFTFQNEQGNALRAVSEGFWLPARSVQFTL